MKKILTLLLLLCASSFILSVNAVEIKIEGRGTCPLTGYDIDYVRSQQDAKMNEKAHNSNIEALQTQQIKEASRQAETRKKQDKRLSDAVRTQVVSKAQERAREAAINILIDRTLGANASKKPEVMEKMADVLSQSSTYIIDENYTGEVQDNNYVAKAFLTVDETEFRTLVSDMGIAINTQEVRAHSIMIILDEFFAKFNYSIYFVFILNIILYSIFLSNVFWFFAKSGYNFILTIIESFVFVKIFNIICATISPIFSFNYDIANILSGSTITSLLDVSYVVVIIYMLLLVIVSYIALFYRYKDKESLVMSCEK